ncbi:MAG: fasciclin domain-containing protein [Parasphingopyxis sp.]|nr:fasciclin domain-containing protein [Sphingomonadales bacterium]
MNRLVLAATVPLLLLGACERVEEEGGDADEAPATTRAGTEPAAIDTPGVASSMDAELSIAENMAASGELTTLHAAVEAAGLAETLAGVGPYTLFAPTDAAFQAVDAGELIERGGPELVSLINSHLLPGVVTAEDLRNAVESGGGSIELATMAGAMLTVTADGDGLVLASGDSRARITAADLGQANGLIHVVDGVLEP